MIPAFNKINFDDILKKKKKTHMGFEFILYYQAEDVKS